MVHKVPLCFMLDSICFCSYSLVFFFVCLNLIHSAFCCCLLLVVLLTLPLFYIGVCFCFLFYFFFLLLFTVVVFFICLLNFSYPCPLTSTFHPHAHIYVHTRPASRPTFMVFWRCTRVACMSQSFGLALFTCPHPFHLSSPLPLLFHHCPQSCPHSCPHSRRYSCPHSCLHLSSTLSLPLTLVLKFTPCLHHCPQPCPLLFTLPLTLVLYIALLLVLADALPISRPHHHVLVLNPSLPHPLASSPLSLSLPRASPLTSTVPLVPCPLPFTLAITLVLFIKRFSSSSKMPYYPSRPYHHTLSLKPSLPRPPHVITLMTSCSHPSTLWLAHPYPKPHSHALARTPSCTHPEDLVIATSAAL